MGEMEFRNDKTPVFEPMPMSAEDMDKFKQELEKYHTGLKRFLMISGISVLPFVEDEADQPIIVTDDPHQLKDSLSKKELEKTENWIKETLLSRQKKKEDK